MTEALFQPHRFTEWFARALSTRAIPCRRVLFETDGYLRIETVYKGTSVVCRLGPRQEGGVFAYVGTLTRNSGEDGKAASLWPVVAAVIAARIERLVLAYRVPLFHLFELYQAEQPHTFGRGLFRERIGPFLVPGRTRYHELFFAGERFDSGALDYRFEGADGEVTIRVLLEPDHPDAVFRTPHLSGVVVSDDRPADHRDDPSWQVERYLGFLLSRCDLPSIAIERSTSRRLAVLDSSNLPWGGELGTQFFQENPGHDFFANFSAINGLRGPVGLVVHSERECATMGIHIPVPILGFLPQHLKAVPEPGLWRRYFLTDLDESMAIHGAEERLKEVLQLVSHRGDLRMILVLQSCLIKVIGDDVGRCVRQCSTKMRCSLVDMDIGRQEQIDPFVEIKNLWKNILDALRLPGIPRSRHSVNLIGYGPSGSRVVRELAALLEAAGLSLNACLFPGLDFQEAERFDAASAHLVNPWDYVQEAFSRIAETSEVPSWTLPMPYGFQGTKEWVEGAAKRLLGHPCDASATVPDSLWDAWEEARGQAASCGIAWVVPSVQAHSLLDETRSFGVRMPAVLAEMNFPLHVFVFDPPEVRGRPERMDPGEMETRLAATLPPETSVRFETFRFVDDLPRILSDPRIRLVYSEMRFDPRVRNAGKGQFSVEDLEMGFLGAVRSARRLLRIAWNPLDGILSRIPVETGHDGE